MQESGTTGSAGGKPERGVPTKLEEKMVSSDMRMCMEGHKRKHERKKSYKKGSAKNNREK